jgi:hypothetical protein
MSLEQYGERKQCLTWFESTALPLSLFSSLNTLHSQNSTLTLFTPELHTSTQRQSASVHALYKGIPLEYGTSVDKVIVGVVEQC